MMTANAQAPVLARARIAGLLYLVIIVCGITSEVILRGGLIVPGDAAATAQNILAGEGLFRLAFLGDSIVFLSDVALAVLLYELFRPAGKTLALVAAAFRLTQSAILGLNLLNHAAVLLVLKDGGALAGIGPEATQSLALLFVTLHKHGYDLALLFFGVHCLVLAALIVRSRLVPAPIGWLVGAAGLVYLAGTYTLFLFPAHAETIAPAYVVALVAEVSLCLWLLVRGVRSEPAV